MCSYLRSLKCQSWRDSSMVKGTCRSCRGPAFSSTNLNEGSRYSVTPVPKDWTPSSGLCGYQVCTQYTCTDAGKTLIQVRKNRIKWYFLILGKMMKIIFRSNIYIYIPLYSHMLGTNSEFNQANLLQIKQITGTV